MTDRYKENILSDEENEVLTETLKVLEEKGYIKKVWNDDLDDFVFIPIKTEIDEKDFEDQ